ncbi:hypothetical protein N483_20315 [Pseudoalteromonas luteoviolacea NCIMB 1944]|uniref:Uncharacterized protein n=1 Tax=Pseudoalteromonas luteoviolacea (strain 2ta16) TaxID=1353533 RepID=V4H0J6_PSEL2|nr:hypothetical protein PL2TA16_01332 [Pseudoalteromonas luteoviolacea 2ta16]KZN38302.1 hypothetical protein N483_20315 [Pseudoalteromonas luteoviolacea NCIMB 1944]
MQCFEFEIFADYFQFYVQDDNKSVTVIIQANKSAKNIVIFDTI